MGVEDSGVRIPFFSHPEPVSGAYGGSMKGFYIACFLWI